MKRAFYVELCRNDRQQLSRLPCAEDAEATKRCSLVVSVRADAENKIVLGYFIPVADLFTFDAKVLEPSHALEAQHKRALAPILPMHFQDSSLRLQPLNRGIG